MKKGSCLPNIFSQVIYSGGYSDGEPPLPIPNREAKPVIADGTARSGGRVGSRRAWKESSDERSSGDSFSYLWVSCENIRCTRHMAMRVSLWTVLMTEPCLSVSLFCRCPIYMSMRVSLWAVPVVDVCLRVSLLCGCPRHMAMRVSLWTVHATELCLRVSLFCCLFPHRLFSLCDFRSRLQSYVLACCQRFSTFAFRCGFRPS